MHFHFRNVNDAFKGLVVGIYSGQIPTRRSPSRVGQVLMVEEPVMVTYSHPCERVLFNQARDANPFFHLFEALWMLAGHNDVAPLVYYNKRMKEYSDDGVTLHGAYGYRWKHSFHGPYVEVDQLQRVARELREDPTSRRAVLQIWHAGLDLLSLSKDIPCNTHAYFAIADGRLNMTVCNRSNDLIWGMLGANVVHFSILQEYLAVQLNVDVGVYHQVTNNLHVYIERWKPKAWIGSAFTTTPYISGGSTVFPLMQDPKVFDRECKEFVGTPFPNPGRALAFREPFIETIALPMSLAFRYHKERTYDKAVSVARTIQAFDWQVAAIRWLQKRKRMWEERC